MTELQIRQKIVNTFISYLGCKESNGTHRQIIDIYNSHTPRARGVKMEYDWPWCAATVSAMAIKCDLTDIMPTECSCSRMIQLYKNIRGWYEGDGYHPQPGDLIMYDWNDTGRGENTGAPEHVGMVVSVTGDTIKVIEGNYGNAVKYRTLKVNGRYIRGYCLPDYASKATTVAPAPNSLTEVAREVINGKWGNGAVRRQKLKAAGYDPAAVQAEVNRLLHGGKSLTDIAREVLNGEWGNGAARKQKLKAAGYDPTVVQAEVNRLCRR